MKFSTPLLSAALVLAVGGVGAAESKAAAEAGPGLQSLSGTVLKCAVSPPTTLVYHDDYCIGSVPNSSYGVVYQVFVPAGGPYTYAWTVPSLRGQTVYSGCTSTSSLCSLTVSRVGDHDNTISVTVTDPATGETISDSVPYSTLATCYNAAFGGWYFC
jgi:hypothetical protein